jgi:hypothetical protein
MEIKCEERYQQALEHAAKTEDDSLQKCLDRLKQWEKNRDSEIILYFDSSPLSFYFEMIKDGTRIMNGGLLFHGSPDESYAVQLVPTKGWAIHT